MSDFCGVIVALALIGLPISVIWLLIRIIRKKKLKPAIISVTSCLCAILIFTVIGVATWTSTDEYKEYIEEENKEKELAKKEEELKKREEALEIKEKENAKKEKTTVEPTEEPTVAPTVKPTEILVAETQIESNNVVTQYPTIKEEIENSESSENGNIEETEEEYKAKCNELWYDDIFFSEENLNGKFVKLDVFFEEARYFTMDSAYDSSVQELKEQWDIYRDFYYCGVLREDADSYVGGQITIYFSEKYDLRPSDYECGQHAIVYGEFIQYKTSTWDGYNTCSIIPKYIEVKEN